MRKMTLDQLDVSIVLPTYNEAENIPVIVPRICQTLQQAGIRGEVVVVDDNSPDHTGAIAERLGKQLPVRTLVRTTERGLATAVIAGFGMATGRVVVVMDADGSHPVEKLPEMVKPILEDRADVTVGSRYIPGGDVDQWVWYRRVVSKTAALMTVGLTKMSDPTSGFMAIDKRLLDGVNLNPIGWKIVLEVVVKAAPQRLLEVPITFVDRKLGASKMSLKEQRNYLVHLLRLYTLSTPGYRSSSNFVWLACRASWSTREPFSPSKRSSAWKLCYVRCSVSWPPYRPITFSIAIGRSKAAGMLPSCAHISRLSASAALVCSCAWGSCTSLFDTPGWTRATGIC